MSAPKVRFLFDFGSPNAYLAHRVIPAIEARAGAGFEYVPVLLGGIFKATGNRSPMEAYAGVPAKLAYERLESDRFVVRHGLTKFAFNPHFPVNTLAIMRGAVAAGRLGVFQAYVETVFAAMWERGEKMDDAAVIARVLAAADLPASELVALTQDQGVKDELVRDTADAVAKGVFGIPSFLVGDDLWFGKDRLGEVEAAIVAAA